MRKIYLAPISEVININTSPFCQDLYSQAAIQNAGEPTDVVDKNIDVDNKNGDDPNINPARGFSFSWEDDWE